MYKNLLLTISSCYRSMPWTLGLIGGDDGLSTLCHSCRFASKTFSRLGYFALRMG